ncbi:hypothetical protein BCR36DRAFT_407824 [Piromyces finnis]|uniref:R3H domain-containing protein n=1 Tax=Piromyces finnis TaxID=1754191 RepID=A0A1Y1VN19_9FUNG|nr:hypothetical protein BCR36DRAFT_407824 [Piromyces finnis]|eukprot:ORX60824.1 hypothetical protein BCR36DRAFT_407824 [Piromyces finnis]
METKKILLQNKQSETEKNNKQENVNEISIDNHNNENNSPTILSKKVAQDSNFKILSKNKMNNDNNNVRSYSSVVGINDSNNTNKIVVKAPLKEVKQDEKQDQEEVVEEIDPFIVERLEDDNDRMFILRLEYEMTNLIKNKKETSIEYQNMNSYQRLIIHKIANYFKLCHINDRNNCSVIVIKTVATRIPKKSFNDIIAKPDDSNELETGNTEIKIMKRNDKKISNNTNTNKTVMKKKSNEHNIKKNNISLEERKLAYDLARARIFDESDQTSNNNLKPKVSKENNQKGIEEDDDKDVYNRSNFIIKPQTPDYSIPQYFNQTFNQSPNIMSQQKFQQSPYQKKFQKPMINNPQLQQNLLMDQNSLINQQQSSPNNLLNNNLCYSSPFNNNNNNNNNNNVSNSHSYSNIRNYSNFNPYNNANIPSNNNPLISNSLINNKNNTLNELYSNNTNTFQNFSSPNQTPTKGHNSSNFNNSPIAFQIDKKFMFSNSPMSINNGNSNNNSNNNNSNNPWISNKDLNYKNDFNVFNNKDNFENNGISSFQASSIYNNDPLSSPISSSNYKKSININNGDMNSMDSIKNNSSFSKLNPNSEIFIPDSKSNKLSLNDSPIASNMNTTLNVNVPEFKPYTNNRVSNSTSFSNNSKDNGTPSLFNQTRSINGTNNYNRIGSNNKPQFMNYSNYNQNKSNYFN